MLVCRAWCCGTTISAIALFFLCVCEQAEKLEVLDHAFGVTSMSASIGQ